MKFKINKEKVLWLLRMAGQGIVGLAVIGAIIYYVIHNTEYSTDIVEEDAMELVNQILEENDISHRCVKITGLPDEIMAMHNSYDLTAELDNGEKLSIRFSRVRKDGKYVHQVKILGSDRRKEPTQADIVTEEIQSKILAAFSLPEENAEFVNIHHFNGDGERFILQAIITRNGEKYLTPHITLQLVEGKPVMITYSAEHARLNSELLTKL